MITVSTLLKIKGYDIYSVEAGTLVLKALELMAEKNIGALLVMDKGNPAGIFSERDFARKVATDSKINLETPVDAFMTTEIYCVAQDETMDEVMALMTKQRFRHLPVCGGDNFIGIISIGDVVKYLIEDKDLLIDNMEKYILGRGYGE
jgi:CBS domain-containing protein